MPMMQPRIRPEPSAPPIDIAQPVQIQQEQMPDLGQPGQVQFDQCVKPILVKPVVPPGPEIVQVKILMKGGRDGHD